MPRVTEGIAGNLLQSYRTATMKARSRSVFFEDIKKRVGVGMNVAGRSRPGEATERKSQRQGPGCIKPCFEIIVTSSLNLKLFFQPDKGSQPGGGWGGRDEV